MIRIVQLPWVLRVIELRVQLLDHAKLCFLPYPIPISSIAMLNGYDSPQTQHATAQVLAVSRQSFYSSIIDPFTACSMVGDGSIGSPSLSSVGNSAPEGPLAVPLSI